MAQTVGCTACAELSFAYGDVTRGPGSDLRSETKPCVASGWPRNQNGALERRTNVTNMK